MRSEAVSGFGEFPAMRDALLGGVGLQTLPVYRYCKSRAGTPLHAPLHSARLERILVNLVLADLPRHAPPRQPAQLGATSDVPPALLERLDDVLSLDLLGRDLEVIGERMLEIDLEPRL